MYSSRFKWWKPLKQRLLNYCAVMGGRPRMPTAVIIEDLFYRLRNPGPWRDLPAEFGLPRSIYGWFRKWTACGLRDRLLTAVAKHRGVLRLVDGTHIPVHQSGCIPRGRAEHQAMGKTRGGRNSKLMALVDARGRLVSCLLAPGQAYEGKYVCALLPAQGTLIIVGDKAYDDDKLRRRIEALGHSACFPTKANRLTRRPFNRRYYRMRYAVEDFFRRLKRWASAAYRRDKLAANYLA